MKSRRPQINFQVEPCLKLLYEEASTAGHWATRLCAAGLLMMIEDPQARRAALNRLRDFEVQYADAGPQRIRAFVEGAEGALKARAPGTKRAPKAPPSRKKAK